MYPKYLSKIYFISSLQSSKEAVFTGMQNFASIKLIWMNTNGYQSEVWGCHGRVASWVWYVVTRLYEEYAIFISLYGDIWVKDGIRSSGRIDGYNPPYYSVLAQRRPQFKIVSYTTDILSLIIRSSTKIQVVFYATFLFRNGDHRVVGVTTRYGLGGLELESQWVARFSGPV
jgi:hypothetical protein